VNTQPPFNDELKSIADNMGIALYARFNINEASLFLRCNESEVKRIIKSGSISYIQLNAKQIEFFGFQLLEHLLSTVVHHKVQPEVPSKSSSNDPERIIRAKEVQDMTGLSRTTLWRLENKNEFPRRLSLGANSVGWKLSDIKNWINLK